MTLYPKSESLSRSHSHSVVYIPTYLSIGLYISLLTICLPYPFCLNSGKSLFLYSSQSLAQVVSLEVAPLSLIPSVGSSISCYAWFLAMRHGAYYLFPSIHQYTLAFGTWGFDFLINEVFPRATSFFISQYLISDISRMYFWQLHNKLALRCVDTPGPARVIPWMPRDVERRCASMLILSFEHAKYLRKLWNKESLTSLADEMLRCTMLWYSVI